MAYRITQLSPIQRIEMEMAGAAGIKLSAQRGGDGGGDKLAGLSSA
jgi:hypothetical protein